MKDNFIFNSEEKKFYLPGNKITYENFFKKLEKSKLGCNIKYDKIYKINISENSKEIEFKDFDKTHKIFITNEDQVLFLVRYFCFEKYEILKNGNKVNIISSSLDFDTVKRIKNYLNNDEYIKANEELEDTNISLNSLSLLYDKYQKYEALSDEFILTKERIDFFATLKSLINEKSFIPICGPKSIGKTTSLLYFKKKYLGNSLYINLSYCKSLYEQEKFEELLLTISKELFSCFDFEEVNKIYSFFEKKTYNSIMNMILELIKYINQNYGEKKIYIILDQYKEKIDPDNKIIKEIKNFTSNKYNFSVIVCNSLNEKDFRFSLELYLKNQENFLLDYLFIAKLVDVPKKEIDQLKDEGKKLLKECGNLYHYFYKIKQNINKMNYKQMKDMIIDDIAKEIDEYYESDDRIEKANKIRKLSKYLNNNISYKDLSVIATLFPLKFFNICVNSKKSFIITDIKEDSNISFDFTYPIVNEAIIKIFYDNKKYEQQNIISNFDAQLDAVKLENNFNEFLWISRFNYSYNNCQIKAIIETPAIIKIDDKIKKTYEDTLLNISMKNDSILITQKESNAQYFDTAILKCLDKKKKLYALYLFQETIHKNAKERLCEILLKTLKSYLRLLFKTKLNIIIEEVYFSYVFQGEKVDKTSVNYCIANQINYLIYYENERRLDDSNINSKIVPSFHYLQSPDNMIKEKIQLKQFDIDLNKESDDKIKNEFNKLHKFLEIKRNRKKDVSDNYKENLNNALCLDKIQFRKYNYSELLLDEELMKEQKSPIIGISFQVDEETERYLNDLHLTKGEKKNFNELVSHFGDNLSILSITKINDLGLNWIPSYRCAILIKDQNKNIYYDIKDRKMYNLKTKKIVPRNAPTSDYYLIIFIDSNLLA